MPLKRSYRRRRRAYKKARRMGAPASRPRRRPMTVGKVKRIISAELKFKTTNHLNNVVNTATPAIIHLSLVAQGNENNERDGNRITPVNTHGHLTIVGDKAGGVNTTPVRVSILRWNEDASLTLPTASEIMQNVDNLGGTYNINNKGMFKVIYSRYFVLVNDITSPLFKKTLRFYLKLSGKILFEGANTLKKYQLYMVIQATSTDVNTPTYSLNNTIRYTDS
jgi:hypothetical protein